jgi:hypothetical protein
MRLFYVPHADRRDPMVADVPHDIGPCISIGADAPDGREIVAIDYMAGTYTAGLLDGTVYPIPAKYHQVDGHGDGAAVVAMPSGERYPFRWRRKRT